MIAHAAHWANLSFLAPVALAAAALWWISRQP